MFSTTHRKPLHTIGAAGLLVLLLAQLAVAVPVISAHGQFISAGGITTFTHTATTAGLNRALYVSVGWNMTTPTPCFGPSISSITYNGVAMTTLTGGPSCNGQTGWALQTFRLVAPPLGTNSVVVVFGGATGATSEWFAAAGVSSVVPNTGVRLPYNVEGGCGIAGVTGNTCHYINPSPLPSTTDNLNVSSVWIQNAGAGSSVTNVQAGAGETVFEMIQLLGDRMENAHSRVVGTDGTMTWSATFGNDLNKGFGGIALGLQGGAESPTGLCVPTLPVTGAGC